MNVPSYSKWDRRCVKQRNPATSFKLNKSKDDKLASTSFSLVKVTVKSRDKINNWKKQYLGTLSSFISQFISTHIVCKWPKESNHRLELARDKLVVNILEMPYLSKQFLDFEINYSCYDIQQFVFIISIISYSAVPSIPLATCNTCEHLTLVLQLSWSTLHSVGRCRGDIFIFPETIAIWIQSHWFKLYFFFFWHPEKRLLKQGSFTSHQKLDAFLL